MVTRFVVLALGLVVLLANGGLSNEELTDWKWPEQESYLVKVNGLKKLNEEGLCHDKLGEIESTILKFCEDHRLGSENCNQVLDDAVERAKAVKEDEATYVPLLVSQSVDMMLKLTVPETGEKRNATLRIYLGDNVMEKVRDFCVKYQMNEETCQTLIESASAEWNAKREKLIQSIHHRFAQAFESMQKIEGGQAMWDDVVLATHNLEQILLVNRSHWQASFLLGGLLSKASASEWIARQLQEIDSAKLMSRAEKHYENSLDAHGSLFQEETLTTVQMSDRARLLELAGTIAFHLGQVGKGLQRLSKAFDLLRSVYEDDETLENVKQIMKNAGLQLAVFQANTDHIYEARTMLKTLCSLNILSKAECFSAKVFGYTLFPFVYESQSEAKVVHSKALLGLEQLKNQLISQKQTGMDEVEILHPYVGFYSVYAGRENDPSAERDYRTTLGRVLRLSTPVLNFVSPKLRQAGKVESETPVRRVGFISSYFYEHSVGKLLCNTILGLLEDLNVSYDIHIVQVGNQPSVRHKTGSCRKLWELGSNNDDGQKRLYTHQLDFSLKVGPMREAFQAVSNLELDVLVFGEIGLVASTYLLAFGRMAPLQIGFWGHPVTSGLPDSIDYMMISEKFLSNPYEPENNGVPLCPSNLYLLGNNSFVPFVEGLICTKTLGTFFEPPAQPTEDDLDEAKAVIRQSLKDANAISHDLDEVNLYYLPHKLMKIHPSMDEQLVRILELDEKAVLLLLCGEDAKPDAFSVFNHAKEKLHNRLIQAGIPENRIAWLPAMRTQVFLAVGTFAAVTLEAFGNFGSGVTALEFISVGVPMVGLPIDQRVTPNAHGMYRTLEEELSLSWISQELSCMELPCYAETAVRFATDKEMKRRWKKLLLSEEARDVIFSNPKVIVEWNEIILGLHFKSQRRFVYKDSEKGSWSGNTDNASTDGFSFKHVDYTFAKEEHQNPQTTQKTFVAHSIQLKDTLKI